MYTPLSLDNVSITKTLPSGTANTKITRIFTTEITARTIPTWGWSGLHIERTPVHPKSPGSGLTRFRKLSRIALIRAPSCSIEKQYNGIFESFRSGTSNSSVDLLMRYRSVLGFCVPQQINARMRSVVLARKKRCLPGAFVTRANKKSSLRPRKRFPVTSRLSSKPFQP